MSHFMKTLKTERNASTATTSHEAHDAKHLDGQLTVLHVGLGLNVPGAVGTGRVTRSVAQQMAKVMASADNVGAPLPICLCQCWHPGNRGHGRKVEWTPLDVIQVRIHFTYKNSM